MVLDGFDLKHRVHIDMTTIQCKVLPGLPDHGQTFHEERLLHKACWTWLILTALWPGGLDSCGVGFGSLGLRWGGGGELPLGRLSLAS